ncbi:MAG: hypothetical protein MZV65_33915 [Chromatiales bacterium]|nr:hypothetical protein [Chromatiales bacterium]
MRTCRRLSRHRRSRRSPRRIVAGLFGRVIGRAGAHTRHDPRRRRSRSRCRLMVLLGPVLAARQCSTVRSTPGLRQRRHAAWRSASWSTALSALMMVVVTFVSLMVHVYTIGYMHDDPGYTRFFSYISLFTFAMLMLVMSNNFLQLFFGWEAVGLVSYLLIGFWYTRAVGDLRQPEGVPGQPRRRLRLPARHRRHRIT